MKKWMTHIVEAASVDAVSKARLDISKIAKKVDCDPLYVFRYVDPNESMEALSSRLDGITAAVQPGDLVFYQYPCYNGAVYEEAFIQRMKGRGVKVAIMVHDSELIRASGYVDEKKLFNLADMLIIHGDRMEAHLVAAGITTPMIHRELFDYLVEEAHIDLANDLERKAVFAGNIRKSLYLQNWNYETDITVFGRLGDLQLSEKVDYQGEHYQEALMRVIPKNRFGIAWDQDIEYGGAYGQYTRVNAPHKVSMYLALGIPPIVWKESAAAQVIEKYQIGLALDSLDEIDGALAALTDEDLHALKQRVNHFSRVLRTGKYTRNAINEVETLMMFPQV